MKIISSIRQMQSYCAALRVQGEKVGFVPTMGYLHEGHLSLVRQSKNECSQTIVSKFINPMQFAPGEDFDQYPRNVRRDIRLLQARDINVLFSPREDKMYPDAFLTSVIMDEMTTVGEGASRPTHFKGVTTVVAKLLNIVQPSVLYLGQKDIQQAVILKKMVQDLNFPVVVKICPTKREKDGLAMSSRNVYLSPRKRESALALITALRTAKKAVTSGECDCKKIIQKMRAVFSRFPEVRLDYILCADFHSFEPVETIERRTVIAAAAFVGNTRLIDNIIVSPPKTVK